MNIASASSKDRNSRSLLGTFSNRPPSFRKLVLAAASMALVSSAHASLSAGNLLKNGSATGAVTDSWTIITNGGSGWAIAAGGDGVGAAFSTSYTLCNRYQTIELMPAGGAVTAADLDAKPQITASEHVCSSQNFTNGAADKFYIKVQLLAADKTTVLAEQSIGSTTALQTCPAAFDFAGNTSKQTITFASGSYPTGVRFIRFEDGGVDSGFWLGQYGAYFDAAVVEFSQDSDGDGLPDVWEATNGTQVNVADASDDPDHDGLTNLQEFQRGTKPNNPDTDADGLSDGVETGDPNSTTNAYHSPTDTGTLPLVADSDGDGIPDGKENPSLPYVDINQPGTSPTMSDTDGDGFTDLREVLSGTNPTDSASFPVFTYTDRMKENFDGVSLNSVVSYVQNGGTFAPAQIASGDAVHNNVAKLTNNGNGDSHNAVAFDAVPSNATSVKFSFDFALTGTVGSAADGIGFGFFKTSDFAATGPINPGVDGQWETPTDGAGIKGVTFGLSGYHNLATMNGPANPTKPLTTQMTIGNLFTSSYNRVTVTAISNGNGTTSFSMDLTYDVDTPDAQTITVFSAVVAPGFDIATDPYRMVIGGRTGGLSMTSVVDNVVLSSTALANPVVTPPVITAYSIDRTTTPAKFNLTWSSQAGATYTVESSTTLTGTWTTVSGSVASGGASTTYSIPLTSAPPASFFRVKGN